MEAILDFDGRQGRFVAQQLIGGMVTDNSEVIDLHCGDCLAIKVKGEWVETRVENDDDDELYGWYFVEIGRMAAFIGQTVRI